MKTIVLTALVGAFIATAGVANAAEFVSDPLVKDFAASGQIVHPHGVLGGL